ncbi:hypothetical protein MPOCJGCO_0248 [Methylobacterium trifolii]|uniref:Uncharacterized protein n=1 Tax=Methylobacterium trifolii TaxID=1003092 RepID=A0ABQ4TS47_9HYPH|nr:hypothetical protein MPOCJGCO_0248 [Methylobacterium trifolii]
MLPPRLWPATISRLCAPGALSVPSIVRRADIAAGAIASLTGLRSNRVTPADSPPKNPPTASPNQARRPRSSTRAPRQPM